MIAASLPPRAKRGEGDHPKGGGGVIGAAFADRARTPAVRAFYPSTRLRLVRLPIADATGRQVHEAQP
jgi:hypothetical protein